MKERGGTITETGSGDRRARERAVPCSGNGATLVRSNSSATSLQASRSFAAPLRAAWFLLHPHCTATDLVSVCHQIRCQRVTVPRCTRLLFYLTMAHTARAVPPAIQIHQARPSGASLSEKWTFMTLRRWQNTPVGIDVPSVES